MSLKHSYTLLAPLYDSLVEPAFRELRKTSLQRIDPQQHREVLLTGIGTGLDIPELPGGPRYTGIDLTPAMLERARRRLGQRRDVELKTADAMALPFTDDRFDAIVMHLILAVVPNPVRALREAERVLRPGGRIFILDKFIRRGQWAISRRLLNLLLRHIATRTDVVFESLLDACPRLEKIHDEPALAKGWFRLIELRKKERA